MNLVREVFIMAAAVGVPVLAAFLAVIWSVHFDRSEKTVEVCEHRCDRPGCKGYNVEL